MDRWLQILAIIGGGGGIGLMVKTLYDGQQKKKDGATGKIVGDVEARRHYVEGVYDDQDWEASQHRYWRDAYYRLLEWVQAFVAEVRSRLDEPPKIPDRPPYPERPKRRESPEGKGDDA